MNTSQLENRIGIVFKNKAFLTQALTHRSYINEHRGEDLQHNERLEYLGDAVLDLIISKHLFTIFPDDDEGVLTAKRSALACSATAAKVARKLGIEGFILLSKGETRDTGRAREIILADTFEAIIGALYLDRGYAVVEEFVHRVLLSECKDSDLELLDAKSKLQIVAQEKFKITPTYLTCDAKGPDHDRIFCVGVYLNTDLLAKGEGKSKKDAEQQAAEKALAVM